MIKHKPWLRLEPELSLLEFPFGWTSHQYLQSTKKKTVIKKWK